MRQIRVPAPALLALVLFVLPAFSLLAENEADTSFDEPGERPDHPEMAVDLPEPELPEPPGDAASSTSGR
jgi:hypothetical protein